jgi:PAS domain S-box-containing protein
MYLLNTILLLLVIILGTYGFIFLNKYRRKIQLWKNESALYVHTQAIIDAFDEVPDTIAVLNSDKKIISVNETSTTMFGKTEKELLEKDIYSLLPIKFNGIIEANMASNIKESFELVINKIPYEITISRKGQLNYVVIIKDITHRKGNEAVVKTLMDLRMKDYDLIKEGELIAGTGTWAWNLGASPDEVRYSPGFASIFDIKPGEIVSAQYLIDIIHIDDQPRVKAEMAKAIESGEGYEMEYRVVRRNKREDLVHVWAVPIFITPNGKMIKLIGVTQIIQKDVHG